MTPDAQVRSGSGRSGLLRVAIGAGLLLVVFLLGYLPPSLRASRVADENRRLQERLTLAGVLGYLGMTNYEVQRNNYASAAEYSTQFFNRVREAAGIVRDEAPKRELEAIINRRDEIMAGLSAANPAVKDKIARMYADVFKAAGVP